MEQLPNYNPKVSADIEYIEEEYGVTVLLAVEVSSRLWGFANEGSDYDVKFVYMKDESKDYFTVGEKSRPYIELENDNYDYQGTDIIKFLTQLRSSNMVAINLIRSTIVYHKSDFYDKALELSTNNWNPLSIYQSKRGWVHSKLKEEMSVKVLLHTAHHTLSCVYMQVTEGEFPPQNLLELLKAVEDDIPNVVYKEIVIWKEVRDSLKVGEDIELHVPAIVDDELRRLTPFHFLHANKRIENEVSFFDKLLRETLC